MHDYRVDIRDTEHPITRGLSSFMANTDEPYAGLKCRSRASFTSWAVGTITRSTLPNCASRFPPVLRAMNLCSDRRLRFAECLDHAGQRHESGPHAGLVATFVRGTEWAATGAVTTAPPPGIDEVEDAEQPIQTQVFFGVFRRRPAAGSAAFARRAHSAKPFYNKLNVAAIGCGGRAAWISTTPRRQRISSRCAMWIKRAPRSTGKLKAAEVQGLSRDAG